jgi:DNA modification methylase
LRNAAKWEAVIADLYRATKQGGVVVWVVADATINGSETGTSFKQALHAKACGFRLHDTMIYKKAGTGACGSNYAYWQAFEYMFVWSKGRPAAINRLTTDKLVQNGGERIKRTGEAKEKRARKNAGACFSTRDNVWTYSVGAASGDDPVAHPAKFPEALAQDHILSWSNEGDTVFDPFLGSGTTGKMSVLNGRSFIGIERDPSYFAIAEQRIYGAQPQMYLEAAE